MCMARSRRLGEGALIWERDVELILHSKDKVEFSYDRLKIERHE